MERLSVVLITYDEEENITRCLESVKWADEIIVVDAESSDRTVELARQYTTKISVFPWKGFAAAKNYGIKQASFQWIFWIDADEEVTSDLKNEILHILENPVSEGYLIPRKANFLGRWIMHSGWYPGYVLRLIRKDCASIPEKMVHEHFEIPNKVSKFINPILHYTDPNIKHYFSKLNDYTSLAAQEMFETGKKFHLHDLLIRPLHIWLKMFILKVGFLDGFQGFLLALFSGIHVFVKYAKLWELQRNSTDHD